MRRAAALALERSKWVAFALCAFECAALATGKVPTLTALSAKHRWLAPVLVGALAIHLLKPAPGGETRAVLIYRRGNA